MAWNPSTDQSVAGYRVRYGTAAGVLHVLDVGDATTADVPKPPGESTYFFAVHAYDKKGRESAPSNQVSYPLKSGLLNVSTRAFVERGENVLIGGFIISGDAPKTMIIRAVGPSLEERGVPEAMADPVIYLHDGSGKLIQVGDNFQQSSGNVNLAAGDPREPAMLATLEPGNYTVVLSGRHSTTGVAMLEVYDVGGDASGVTAISTRGMAGTGDKVLIGGFIICGSQPARVIARALGPSLSKRGIEGALQDPTLSLYDRNGSAIFANDNWRSDQEQQVLDSSIAPADNRESAIVAKLPPGPYTAVVGGRQESSGVALVELYFPTR